MEFDVLIVGASIGSQFMPPLYEGSSLYMPRLFPVSPSHRLRHSCVQLRFDVSARAESELRYFGTSSVQFRRPATNGLPVSDTRERAYNFRLVGS
jgi:hypothetical protein